MPIVLIGELSAFSGAANLLLLNRSHGRRSSPVAPGTGKGRLQRFHEKTRARGSPSNSPVEQGLARCPTPRRPPPSVFRVPENTLATPWLGWGWSLRPVSQVRAVTIRWAQRGPSPKSAL